jgi:O-antigen/teichoic acid export membrane protein
MAHLALGGVAARTVSIFTVPIVTRIYTPADFGTLSIYVSVVQIILPLLSLRYVFAIPLPRRDPLAFNLWILCGTLIIAESVLLTIALMFFSEPLLGLFSADKLLPWWFLIPLGAFTAGIGELLSSWAMRRRAYKRMAVNSIAVIVLGEGIKICLGWLGARPLGLVLGQMTGQSGGIVSFTRAFLPQFRQMWSKVSWQRVRLVACYYATYPMLRLPSQFLLAFAIQAPLLYTGRLYGIDEAGQLGLALTTLALPLNLIGQAVGQAYYAEVARIGRSRPDEIYQLSKATQYRLFFLGTPPALLLVFVGEPLFAFAFGPKWGDAGVYASTLAFYMLLQFTSAPLIQLLNVFGRQGVFLGINIFRTALIISLFWACHKFSLDMLTYVRAYSATMAIFYFAITIYIFHVIHDVRRSRRGSKAVS